MSNNSEVNLLKAKLAARKKDKLVYLLAGLVVGLVIGFLVTDNLNGPAATAVTTPVGVTALPGGGQLPPDHPPIGGHGGGMQPEMRGALQRAKDDPKDFEAQMRAAAMYYQIRMLDKALEYLERAHRLKPDDYDALVALANANYDLDKFTDAIPLYERALKQKPEDAHARTDLGSSYRNAGQLDRAVAEYRKALGYQPKHDKAHYNLALALLDKKDARGAAEVINRLAEIDPQNAGLATLRGKLGELMAKG